MDKSLKFKRSFCVPSGRAAHPEHLRGVLPFTQFVKGGLFFACAVVAGCPRSLRYRALGRFNSSPFLDIQPLTFDFQLTIPARYFFSE